MTMTIDLSPETEAWLDEEARKRGLSREMVAKLALEAFAVRQREEEAERLNLADWQGLSQRTLQEYWINDHDAIYDTPFLPGEDTQTWIARLRQMDSEQRTQTSEADKITQI